VCIFCVNGTCTRPMHNHCRSSTSSCQTRVQVYTPKVSMVTEQCLHSDCTCYGLACSSCKRSATARTAGSCSAHRLSRSWTSARSSSTCSQPAHVAPRSVHTTNTTHAWLQWPLLCHSELALCEIGWERRHAQCRHDDPVRSPANASCSAVAVSNAARARWRKSFSSRYPDSTASIFARLSCSAHPCPGR
jgi:hypothetical protein